MKLYNNRNAQILAEAANATIENFQDAFFNALFSREIITEGEHLYGSKFRDAIESSTTIKDIFEALQESGITSIRPEHYDALMNVYLMGEGDCPECGGDLEAIETHIDGCTCYDYDCPPEYKTTTTYRCPICGEIITKQDY